MDMRSSIIAMLVLAAGASITVPAEAQNIGTPQEIKSVMKRVAD